MGETDGASLRAWRLGSGFRVAGGAVPALEGMGKKVYTGEYDYMLVLPLWGPQSTDVGS